MFLNGTFQEEDVRAVIFNKALKVYQHITYIIFKGYYNLRYHILH